MGGPGVVVLSGFLAAAEPDEGSWGMAIAGVIMLGLIICGLPLLKLIVNRMGTMCSFCGHPRSKPIRELSESDREEVLSYFREYEGRTPDLASMFVCPQCGVVCDDFSGEKHSREPDGGCPPGGEFLPAGVSGCRAFCKNCGNQMLGIAKVGLEMECRHCKTVHTWQKWRDGKYTYLTPPEGTTVRQHAWTKGFGHD